MTQDQERWAEALAVVQERFFWPIRFLKTARQLSAQVSPKFAV